MYQVKKQFYHINDLRVLTVIDRQVIQATRYNRMVANNFLLTFLIISRPIWLLGRLRLIIQA